MFNYETKQDEFMSWIIYYVWEIKSNRIGILKNNFYLKYIQNLDFLSLVYQVLTLNQNPSFVSYDTYGKDAEL